MADSEESLQETAEAALAQIGQMDYQAEFREQDVESVWKYGIAFYGKKLRLVCG